jgi:hypothetical protein
MQAGITFPFEGARIGIFSEAVLSPLTPSCRSGPTASGKSNQLFCFAVASRAFLSCFQLGAYLSA